MYVWFDALTNYLTAAGFPDDDARLDRYWPADVHLMGKEIVRQHTVYWPAFLMAAGLPLPRRVIGHGWWLMNEAKMSKSLGNVVTPQGYVERFGVDALRYFVMREMVARPGRELRRRRVPDAVQRRSRQRPGQRGQPGRRR